jgi:hypothetical protein
VRFRANALRVELVQRTWAFPRCNRTPVERDRWFEVHFPPALSHVRTRLPRSVGRVILTDPSYLRAAKEAMEIDPDARSRLFESSALMERLVRNTLIGAYEDRAAERNLLPE